MGLKLYFIASKNEIRLIANLIDSTNDSTTWVLPANYVLKEQECQFLANVDWNKKIIESITETYDQSYFISNSKKEALKKANLQFMADLNKKDLDLPIPIKPDSLYLSKIKWQFLTTSLMIGKYPLLIGPKGCGKTSTAYDLAKATERDFFPINCGAIFKPKQTLVGTVQAKDGSTFLVNSEFMKYYTSDKPTLIFLDELSRIPQGAANYFMTILDRLQSYLYIEEQGERVYKGKDVTFIAAANFGYEYTDTRNVDGALMDRFIKIMIDYLPEDEEIELLQNKAPKANKLDIKSLVKNANDCREAKDTLRVGVSTRQLVDMAHYLEVGFTLKDIVDEIFVNLFFNGTMDERDVVKKMFEGTL